MTTATLRKVGAAPKAATSAPSRADAAVPPVAPAALELLARSDAELVAAQLAGTPDEQFLHAHLAALRAGAALLQVTGRPGGRARPRTVWDMVAAVAPDLAPWTAYFAAGAAIRSAVEAGRDGVVDVARAERTLAAAEDFQDSVRVLVAPEVGAGQGALSLRAS